MCVGKHFYGMLVCAIIAWAYTLRCCSEDRGNFILACCVLEQYSFCTSVRCSAHVFSFVRSSPSASSSFPSSSHIPLLLKFFFLSLSHSLSLPPLPPLSLALPVSRSVSNCIYLYRLNIERHLKFIMTRFRLGISDIPIHYYWYKRHAVDELICPLCREVKENDLQICLMLPGVK